jgi:CheY-like chemotaxis protein
LLVVDDNPTIHEDFQKILLRAGAPGETRDTLADLEDTVFEEETPSEAGGAFELDSAYQGEAALEKVCAALHEGRPYPIAFVDMRMPPGLDGVETIRHLWEVDPRLQVVICTAYSDYSWESILKQLSRHDNMMILKKPFDNIEVAQIVRVLLSKWLLTCQVEQLSETLRAVRAGKIEPA